METIKNALGMGHHEAAKTGTDATHTTTDKPNTGTTGTNTNDHHLTSDYGFGDRAHKGEVLSGERESRESGPFDSDIKSRGFNSDAGVDTGRGLGRNDGGVGERLAERTAVGTGAGAGIGAATSHHDHHHSTGQSGLGSGTGAGLTGSNTYDRDVSSGGMTGNTGTGLTGNTGNTGSSGLTGMNTSTTTNTGNTDPRCSHGHAHGTPGHGRISQGVRNTANRVEGEWEGFHTGDGHRFECDTTPDASQFQQGSYGGQGGGLENTVAGGNTGARGI